LLSPDIDLCEGKHVKNIHAISKKRKSHAKRKPYIGSGSSNI